MTDPSVLEIRVKIDAGIETVYRYLSEPELFRAWMGDAVIGAGAGGGVQVSYPNGVTAKGVIVEQVPPRRVVFSWGYEGS